MKSQFYANGELNDSKIIEALNEALESYENGELVEARETLSDIVDAIDEFDKKYSVYEEPEYPKLQKDKLPGAKEMAEITKKANAPTKALVKEKMSESILKEIKEAADNGSHHICWGYEDWCYFAPGLVGVDESLEQDVFEELMEELQNKGYTIDSHIGTLKIWW